MDNMINIKSNWKHASLEYQIKKFETAQDLSRSAVLSREIKAAEKVGDWKPIRALLSRIERNEEAPVFGNLQAKYDNESSEILERVKKKILLDLKDDLKVLQIQYLVQLLQVNYLTVLKEVTLAVKTEDPIDVEEDIDAPEMAKLLVKMILLDKNCDELKKIKGLLVEWRNR